MPRKCIFITKKNIKCKNYVTCKNNPNKYNVCHCHLQKTKKIHNGKKTLWVKKSDIKLSKIESNNSISEYGICCFCNEACNPSSQSCGRCSRSIISPWIV